jgi:hypothetical protein
MEEETLLSNTAYGWHLVQNPRDDRKYFLTTVVHLDNFFCTRETTVPRQDGGTSIWRSSA